MDVHRQSLSEPTSSAHLSHAVQMLHREADAIVALAQSLDESFAQAVEAILSCSGQVVVSGMGKAGLIGQKISATMASTGTRSIFLHPAEAVHGDLGRVEEKDIVLLLSYSGETEELTRLLPLLRSQASCLIAVTSSKKSTLGSFADILLPLGPVQEACPLGLAPSASTTAMLALGDSLALVVSQTRGFTREHFARFHPAGNLGRKLTPVDQVMRPVSTCRVASASLSVCDALVAVSRPGRRSGAVLLTDDEGRLAGIFTDSDLAKLLERRMHGQLDEPIANVMTTRFRTIQSGARLSDALHMLAAHKISELPVIDDQGKPLGLIDITDIVGLVAQESSSTVTATRSESVPTEPALSPEGELISIPLPQRTKPKG